MIPRSIARSSIPAIGRVSRQSRATPTRILLFLQHLPPPSSPFLISVPTSTPTLLSHTHTHFFSTTPNPQKKGHAPGKRGSTTSESSHPEDQSFDYDSHLTQLTEDITTLHKTLQTNLTKLRTNGSPTSTSSSTSPLPILESLIVTLDKTTTPPTTAALRDLAHITPKGGRHLQITLYESTNVKKVISAIQKADLNMQPMQDAHNPLVLTIPLPPPTKEGRLAMAEQVGKVGEKARGELRLLRQASHKKIRGLKGERPDDIHKADQKLEKIVKAAEEEIKKVVDAAQKAVMEQ